LINHFSFRPFLEELAAHLGYKRVAIIIDEFDAIPKAALSDFLYTLRKIYHTKRSKRSPYSVGIVGVKSINQLNYDRSISPFNIQDDFSLQNFTLDQVRHLLGQYTEEVGQQFDSKVIENRLAQMLTDEMEIPRNETITAEHFEVAHQSILRERNTNITHLTPSF